MGKSKEDSETVGLKALWESDRAFGFFFFTQYLMKEVYNWKEAIMAKTEITYETVKEIEMLQNLLIKGSSDIDDIDDDEYEFLWSRLEELESQLNL